MRKCLALILALALALTLFTVPAFAITDEQVELVNSYIATMNALYAEAGQIVQDVYSPDLDAYVSLYFTDFSIDDVLTAAALGTGINTILHDGFTEVDSIRRDAFTQMGISWLNIINIGYSSEGKILYLGINGTDYSDLA